MSLLAILLLLVLALSLLLVVPRKGGTAHQHSSNPDVDEEELRDAEEELDELSADVTPEEADDMLPDWGPGVPKYRRESRS